MQFSSNLVPFCSRSLFFNFRSNDFVNFFSALSFFFLYMIFEMTVYTGTIRLAIKLLRIYLKWNFWCHQLSEMEFMKCNLLPTFNIMNNSFCQTLIAEKKTITKLPNDEFSIQIYFPVFPPFPTEFYLHLFCLFFYNFLSQDIRVFGSQSTTESIIIHNMVNLSNKSDLKRFYNWKFNHFPDVFWSTSSLNYNEEKKSPKQ